MVKLKISPYEFFTKLMSLGKSMRTHCHRAIEDEGLTMNETDVLLAIISSEENNTVKAISQSANISKGNISQAVESLKNKGYVTTTASTFDRRSVKILLTEKAAPVVEKLEAAEDEYFSHFMVNLQNKDDTISQRVLNALQSFSLPKFLNKLSKKDIDNEKR